MIDDLEQRLRALRPVPIPATVRLRIAAAVRVAPRNPRSAPNWLPALAAAALAVAVLAVVQPAAPRQEGGEIDDRSVSYGLLLRHVSAPEELLEMIDRSRRPIPRFSASDHENSERNRP